MASSEAVENVCMLSKTTQNRNVICMPHPKLVGACIIVITENARWLKGFSKKCGVNFVLFDVIIGASADQLWTPL